MSLWTAAEFQRVAMNTRLSERTINACRSVLVDGMTGSEAAKEHKMFHPQISRSIATLRDRQLDMVESANHLTNNNEALLKFTVLQIAKNIIGEAFVVHDASPGHTYEGPVLVSSHGFVIQQVGRSGVLHDLGALDTHPQLSKRLSIAYPREGPGKAIVSEVAPASAMAVEHTR